jgi:enediyne polyketide synthase
VGAALTEAGWEGSEHALLLAALERRYKAPFPEPGEETLAGGLSNTIAGRICNHFDLKGGGYTVDGACASSLLAVANACSALAAGDLDVAVVGGVDLSLDPFELVGFARAGALSAGEMRVYDRRSTGFLPGEGCGILVLMRTADAAALRRAPYAVIHGWGISSDGSGGLTRPDADGQLLALRRAYARAGFGPETVAYFEGHGTGTRVGDETELRALAAARRAGRASFPAAIGSVKAVVGHTKAAAGAAGLIKAAMALHAQVVPPTTGCRDPHPELVVDDPVLRVVPEGAAWPADLPLRAGVSSFGFGGINTHVALESGVTERRTDPVAPFRGLLRSRQDTELFLLDAESVDSLAASVERLRVRAAFLSRAELGDAAAALLAGRCGGSVRAAVVASSAAELSHRLEVLLGRLRSGVEQEVDVRGGVFLGRGSGSPSIGFLFPGQGSPAHLDGGILRRRFAAFEAVHARAALPRNGDGVATELAQPAIVAAAAAAVALLSGMGLAARFAVGHSVGELVALHWGGALSLEALLRTAAARGKAMAELGNGRGAMLAVGASRAEAEELVAGTGVVVAAVNGPDRTVASGSPEEIAWVEERARSRAMRVSRLAVSHAFHSPLVAAAVPSFERHLREEELRPLRGAVASTVAGRLLGACDDLRALLARQITAPVLFSDAVESVRSEVDLWIEAGPGHTLGALVASQTGAPVVSLDAGGPSIAGLLSAVGCAFALGAPVRPEALLERRFHRPIDLDRPPRFLASPCEMAPPGSPSSPMIAGGVPEPARESAARPGAAPAAPLSVLEVVRALVAGRAELPPEAVRDHDLLLSDLHLNSIVVAQLVGEAVRLLGLPPSVAAVEYSAATVAQLAESLEEFRATGVGASSPEPGLPAGVDAWVRPFTTRLEPRRLRQRPGGARPGAWSVLGQDEDPLAAVLRGSVVGVPGEGVIVCLPAGEPDERHLALLLEGVRASVASSLVVVQRDCGGAAFARALSFERPQSAVLVVNVPAGDPRIPEWVAAEAGAALPGRYTEAHYGADGTRREPVLAAHALPREGTLPLGSSDVLLVTGGGKGIAAEAALALARESGIRLVLLGRSRPEHDSVLAGNLERMAAQGAVAVYHAVDVADPAAVAAAVRAAEAALGPVTAVLHGAGVNVPRRTADLDEAAVRETLRPKVEGLRSVLAALDPARLRLLVAFSSIIARTGLDGEAHYALANEWMGREVEAFAAEHPGCRTLCLEWSVWSGVGMGERLGTLEVLARRGISPIPLDRGLGVLRALVSAPPPAVCMVVAGRFGPPPTLHLEDAELPLYRFLEHPRVHYPGVELVVEATLSLDSDPYLDDHLLGGERVFPAVMGLEAMAQAAMAVAGWVERPLLEEVAFTRPVVVPASGGRVIRIAALVRTPGEVEVVLRSAETGFGVDHFRARCRPGAAAVPPPLADGAGESRFTAPLESAAGLYGDLLFQGERFRRLSAYRRIGARECEAELNPDGKTRWFGPYSPAERVLGDPGARDAAIHVIQPCIPHLRLLPVGVDRLVVVGGTDTDRRVVRAVEREAGTESFVYDVRVTDTEGRLLEWWEGLRLRRVDDIHPGAGWPLPLLRNYLQRRLEELSGRCGLSVWIENGPGEDRHSSSLRAQRQVLGDRAVLLRRPDGKPDPAGPHARGISVAHAGDLTLALADTGPLGCDLEPVRERSPEEWTALLGADGFELARAVACEGREPLDTSCTRIWSAREALKKSGAADAPLGLQGAERGGWIVLSAGGMPVPTASLRIPAHPDLFVAALACGAREVTPGG